MTTATWTPAHKDRNPWRREWFAAEPCPGCGETNVIIDCGQCDDRTTTPHECVEYASCMTCPWRDDD